jgi:hypothetical protein
VKGGLNIMNEVSQLSVVLSRIVLNETGKATRVSRRFANLNPQATNDQLRQFKAIIEQLINETFDTFEVVKTIHLQ